MKTSELTGAALDWAVAKCEGNTEIVQFSSLASSKHYFAPSKKWAQGGPIIEREGFVLAFVSTSKSWVCHKRISKQYQGPTPLIAAMRCFVASKFGDTVEIPDELAV